MAFKVEGAMPPVGKSALEKEKEGPVGGGQVPSAGLGAPPQEKMEADRTPEWCDVAGGTVLIKLPYPGAYPGGRTAGQRVNGIGATPSGGGWDPQPCPGAGGASCQLH